jgi:hypothetical protein
MPTIPDPSDLLDVAKSTTRPIEDREWKRYQRYLRKLKEQRANGSYKKPITFEEFCEKERIQEINNKTP